MYQLRREHQIYQDYFCLVNQNVYFCETCAQKAEPLLQDIKAAITMNSYQNAKEKFAQELPQSGLSEEAQKYLQYEFDDLAQSIPGVESKKLRNARVFNGSFSGLLRCDLSGRQNDHRVRTGRADAVHQAADPRWRVSCCDGSL